MTDAAKIEQFNSWKQFNSFLPLISDYWHSTIVLPILSENGWLAENNDWATLNGDHRVSAYNHGKVMSTDGEFSELKRWIVEFFEIDGRRLKRRRYLKIIKVIDF